MASKTTVFNCQSFLYILSWFLLNVRADNFTCSTKVSQGSLRGVVMGSLYGRRFCGYLAVPYAKPPVQEFRFRDPKQPSKWEGVRDATERSKLCIGAQLHENQPAMDEDCLYLNIFTLKSAESSEVNGTLPVLVFIPDDSFLGDESYMYGPDYLMEHEIVLVMVSYRVGALGFLSTSNLAAPGNFGLKDQVQALKWIKKNIKAFGGDPDRVTIHGHGGGAACVQYHLLSPMSKGLFHRAISQSGSALDPNMRTTERPREQALRFGRTKNCTAIDDIHLLTCLRLLNQSEFMNTEPIYFGPTVETYESDDEGKFLEQHPLDIVRSGNFNKVPWLMGTVADEGATAAADLLQNKSAVYVWNDNSDDLLVTPNILRLIDDKKIMDGHWTRILNFYLGEESHQISSENFTAMMKLFGDRLYNFGMHMSAVLHSLAGHTDIYKYNFAFNGSSHYKELPEHFIPFVNTNHGDDLLYIFKLPMLDTFPPGYPEIEVISKLTKIVTDFAKYGNLASTVNVTWNPVGYINKKDIHVQYMDMTPATVESNEGLNFTMQQDLYRDRMQLWLSIPLPENDTLADFRKKSRAPALLPTCYVTVALPILPIVLLYLGIFT